MKTNTNTVPQWAKLIRTGLDEVSKGFEKLGASIKKSGIFPHLAVLWCLGWGAFGLLFTIWYIFSTH